MVSLDELIIPFEPQHSDDLISFLHAEPEKLNMGPMATPTSVKPFGPVLRASPNITNMNEIYQDETSTLSLTPRNQLNFNVTSDVISEEPEEEPGLSLEKARNKKNKSYSLDEIHDPLIIDSNKSHRIATEIFNQTYSEIPIDKYCAFLGTSNPFSISVCSNLMELLQPWPSSLIESVRKICSKIYLIGEAAQIDQVLEIFSQSWTSRYPDNSMGDYKTIHIICFALLILNSDLHSEQNLESKFTRDEFVENTWVALTEDETVACKNKQEMTPTLKAFYDSIQSEPLELLKVPKKKQSRNFSVTSNGSGKKQDSLTNVSVRSHRNSKRLSSIGSTMSLHREPSISAVSDNIFEVDYKKDKYDDRLEKLGPPWLIEGIMKSEGGEPVAKKKKASWFSWLTQTSMITNEMDLYNIKNWKQSIVIIQRGLLKQYSFGSISDRKNFTRTKSDKYVNTIKTYNLYSAMASLVDDQIISNSNQKTNGIAWLLTVPNLLSNDYNEDKKIVYYAPSLEVANNFIETCNFWAARITSIPSTEDKIVTSSEFGWSSGILNNGVNLENVNISKWECLLSIESSFLSSTYSLSEQYTNLKHYVTYLENTMEDHDGLKKILERVWGQDEILKEKYQLVMTNWSEKYVHLYKQHSKFKTYLDSLAFAISFRSSKF